MKLHSIITRQTIVTFQQRYSPVFSTILHNSVFVEAPKDQCGTTSPIVQALQTRIIKSKPPKHQSIPHPHRYDLKDCFLFQTNFIATLGNGAHVSTESDFFRKEIEASFFYIFSYLQNQWLTYLLDESNSCGHFLENIIQFDLKLKLKVFHHISHLVYLFSITKYLATTLRKARLFGVKEYDKFSFFQFFTYYLNVKFWKYDMVYINKEIKQQFDNFSIEMKNNSLKPSVQMCLNALQQLTQRNSSAEKSRPLINSITKEHPELIHHPRVVGMSTLNPENVLTTAAKLHSYDCSVIENNIYHLIRGLLYLEKTTSYDRIEIAYQIMTKDLLSHLSSKTIDLFLIAAYRSNVIDIATRFYLIIRDTGYFMGKEGFNFVLNSRLLQGNHGLFLQFWEDICAAYHSHPPPWAYGYLVNALCSSMGGHGVHVFDAIIREAIGDVVPTNKHWAWSPGMFTQRFRGYSNCSYHKGSNQLLHDITELKIPLTPPLVAVSFEPIKTEYMLEGYFPRLIEVLVNSAQPLSLKSLKMGLSIVLERFDSHTIYKALNRIDIFNGNIGDKLHILRRPLQPLVHSRIVKDITRRIQESHYRRKLTKMNPNSV